LLADFIRYADIPKGQKDAKQPSTFATSSPITLSRKPKLVKSAFQSVIASIILATAAPKPLASPCTAKIIFNSVLSEMHAKFMTLDIKDFCLNMPMY
jgi:hypothetical protein